MIYHLTAKLENCLDEASDDAGAMDIDSVINDKFSNSKNVECERLRIYVQ